MGRVNDSETDSISLHAEDVINNCADIANEAKKRYKCVFPGCSLAFLRPSRLERHVRVHTGERNFKCPHPECNKAYTNNCHLKRHITSHSAMKQVFKCPECTLHISNQHNLKRHIKQVHNSEKLTCKECKCVFRKKYKLQEHMLEYSVPYTCEICDKNFKDVSKLNRHKKIHEPGNKQYPCPVLGCAEVLDKWTILQAHIKTQHVNDHRCKDCNKVFFTKDHLKAHSVVHVKDRPRLPCPYEKCPRAYLYRRNLTMHIRICHLNEKFECDICKVKVGTKRTLRFHIEKLHMMERKIKEIKRKQQKKRKDAGIPKRSGASKLIGVDLPREVEKLILERKESIEYIDQLETHSLTDEPDTDS